MTLPNRTTVPPLVPRPGGVALVVDDEPSLREAVADVMTGLGYQVLTAEHGRKALDLLRAAKAAPDLILLDLMMPVMNGWEFLEERRKDPALSAIPVVVISSALDASAQLPDVAGYLKKPMREDHLIDALTRLRGGTPPAPPVEEAPHARSEGGPLHVLLVQDSDSSARQTAALLQGGSEFRFDVKRHAPSASELSREELAVADVVLFDLGADLDAGLARLQKTVRRAAGVPVVALLDGRGPEARSQALWRGAQDALARAGLTPELLGRMLHHAIERSWLRAELEKASELAAHEREHRRLKLFSQSRSAAAAEALGQTPLKSAAPAAFQKFTREYIVICERAVAAREHELESAAQRAELQRLSAALSALRVGPGDIVDLYQAALASGWTQETPLDAARRDEARLMLIGVLGHVLASYRLYVEPKQPAAPVTP